MLLVGRWNETSEGLCSAFGKKGIASIEPRILNWGNIRQFGKLLIKSPAKLPKAIQMFWLPKRRSFENMPWCGGDQWFILRKSTVDKIVKRINEDNRIMEESENTIVPDEIIFATLITLYLLLGRGKTKLSDMSIGQVLKLNLQV